MFVTGFALLLIGVVGCFFVTIKSKGWDWRDAATTVPICFGLFLMLMSMFIGTVRAIWPHMP